MQRTNRRPAAASATDDIVNRSGCDRRLSRAARSILLEKLLASPAVQRMSVMDKKIGDGGANSLWLLLDYLLLRKPSSSSSSSSYEAEAPPPHCPLLPHLDMWKDQELHSAIRTDSDFKRTKAVSSFTSSHFTRMYRGSQKHQSYTYQCLYCQKLFSSRYYLDLHQATYHHHSNATTTTTTTSMTPRICPATDWCQFLSPTACHHRALQDEPYYGRGSAGRRNDRYKVEAQLWKQAHAVPCTVASAREAEERCRTVGEICFGHHDDDEDDRNKGNMKDYWDEHVCHKASFSCPNRLQQLYFRTQVDGDLMLRQVHEWQDDWMYWYEEHHALGWTGTVVLTVLVACYGRIGYQKWQGYRRSRRAGPSLLRGCKTKRH